MHKKGSIKVAIYNEDVIGTNSYVSNKAKWQKLIKNEQKQNNRGRQKSLQVFQIYENINRLKKNTGDFNQ